MAEEQLPTPPTPILHPKIELMPADVLEGLTDILLPFPGDDIVPVDAPSVPNIFVSDNGDGTWNATGESPYVELTDGVFQLNGVDGSYLNPAVYELTVNE